MQNIQEKTGGFYRPSPGTVYPALEMLEDLELICRMYEGHRKNYELTVKGREELEKQRPLLEDIYEDMNHGQSPEQNEFFEETYDQVMGMFKIIARSFHRGGIDTTKIDNIREIIQETVQRVHEILNQEQEK
jgi:DNA-binding PadR family transcriptional regulator